MTDDLAAENARVREEPLSAQATRCECGHSLKAHRDQQGECSASGGYCTCERYCPANSRLEMNAIAAENTRLREALARLARRAVYPQGGWQVCRYCGRYAKAETSIRHEAECPVTIARRAGGDE